VAVNVSQTSISFAFNLGQICALIAGRGVYESEPLHLRMDETYIKVKGQWMYLYRAVDKEGNTVDFMLSEKRDEPAARAFFMKAIGSIL
jgi:transposase-like protein